MMAAGAVDKPAHLLEVRDLRVEFAVEGGAVTAVDGVSFHINPGETLVVVGESGSGKSVTALSLMRLIESPPGRIASGEILLRGRDGRVRDLTTLDMAAMRALRGNDIAMIFQEPMTSLNPVYTVGDQIIEAIQLHQGKSGREAFAHAVEMLEHLGIPEPQRRMKTYPHQMSGGMRQRAMIAMALSCNPALLIADEPTTALDVTIQAQILELIKRLQRELGMAVIFITHNLGVAAEIADRIMVMYAGRVVEAGPARAIFREPRMPYTIGLLNSVPRLGMAETEASLVAIPGNVPDARHVPSGCAFHPRCGFFEPGLCDTDVPALEPAAADHAVRCRRWRAVAERRTLEAPA
ncbi:MAG TPA: ABC transporter ATP-binding protein [Stellaceae bacterium]|jgi:oligopeptide transport system ATP-binding protein|nr:ABC transporter ATP-binding protein [Stellaceae bacterium]